MSDLFHYMASEVTVTPFDGNQELADTVAALHLEVRYRQRSDGENQFRTDITDSQADLCGMQQYYVEPGGNFWIAHDVVANQVAGFVGLKRTTEENGQVKRMAVMPRYRGQRLGQRLMAHLIYFAEDRGLSTVSLATGEDEHARELVYKPFGFVDIGYDQVHQDHRMELILARATTNVS